MALIVWHARGLMRPTAYRTKGPLSALLSEAPPLSLLPLLCGLLHGRALCPYLKSLGMYSCCGESSWEPSLCVGVRVCVSLPELLRRDKSNDVINGANRETLLL